MEKEDRMCLQPREWSAKRMQARKNERDADDQTSITYTHTQKILETEMKIVTLSALKLYIYSYI